MNTGTYCKIDHDTCYNVSVKVENNPYEHAQYVYFF